MPSPRAPGLPSPAGPFEDLKVKGEDYYVKIYDPLRSQEGYSGSARATESSPLRLGYLDYVTGPGAGRRAGQLGLCQSDVLGLCDVTAL